MTSCVNTGLVVNGKLKAMTGIYSFSFSREPHKFQLACLLHLIPRVLIRIFLLQEIFPNVSHSRTGL